MISIYLYLYKSFKKFIDIHSFKYLLPSYLAFKTNFICNYFTKYFTSLKKNPSII